MRPLISRRVPCSSLIACYTSTSRRSLFSTTPVALSSSSSSVTLEGLATLSKASYIRTRLLHDTPASAPKILSVDEYLKRVVTAPNGSTDDGGAVQVSQKEALEFLAHMHNATLIEYNKADGLIHLRPEELSYLYSSTSSSTTENSPERAVATAVAGDTAKTAQVFRQRFWGGVAVVSGTQMLVLSYLTFVVCGWDMMEPICYFLTTGTSVGFYAYYWALKREHSLTDFDKCTLLARKYVLGHSASKGENSGSDEETKGRS